ncbi:UvrD-helicase domain-containing protein [Actinosynnema sp. NPDC047251]|uniref:Superfamily I DNA and RNA helicase-like protein n=1 Tax=Saccharothrix espanaensis (strain ATCC 51144 / DSM 44229 / JCM 9112 / NBRC 15066 / NRRL 15764) TaxID=1179773 RepID=K0K942_SACES|nr:Superfamily I DNA and RNA helicase-like protein [Saccharothrix espanaensis DSM 44229]
MTTGELSTEQETIASLYARLDLERAAAKAELAAALLDPHERRWHREVAVRTLSDQVSRLTVADQGLCFGRTDHADGHRTYIGRVGLLDPADDYRPLLTDWRAPIARPFYTATGAHPEGLVRRRHFRTRGRCLESFHDDELRFDGTTLLAALNAPRSDTMRDIVATIQAEQDEVIRLDHRGVLVIEGGPGTGKTAVALHRVAYLLYTQRDRLSRQGVLVVGPNPGFVDYIGDVLPSLGETDVVFATPGELFPGVRTTREDTPELQGLKGGRSAVALVREAVADRQELPDEPLPVELEDVTVFVDAAVAAVARDRARTCGLRHNEARQVFRDALADVLVAPALTLIGEDWPELAVDVRRELAGSADLTGVVDALWPALTARTLLADLYEGRCFALGYPELHREDGRGWTVSDVPLLDEAAELLGTSGEAERVAERDRALEVEYARGVLEVIDTDEAMHEDELRAVDLVDAEWLADRHEAPDHRTLAERAAGDREWTYGHVVVDEAQELSEMDWRVLMRRSPNRSMTIVGDLAQRQADAGARSWEALLAPYVRTRWVYRRLTVNYRTPAAIMRYAAPALAEVDPAAELPTSVRRGEPPVEMLVDDLAVVSRLVAGPGTFAVISVDGPLTPRASKGLEFDTVVVVEPERMTAAERYVALTRATRHLVVVRRT